MPSPAPLTVGRLCWLLQPLSIGVELVTAARVTAPYSFVDNPVSDLAAVGCGTVPYPGVDVAVCSPLHALMNAAFGVGGALLIIGALALRPTYAWGKAGNLACVLWLLSGLSSIGVGLVPVDVDLDLHIVISTLAIFLPPVALLLHAGVLARSRGRRWWALVAVAVVVLAVSVFFLVRLDVQWGGLLERAAIWPVLIACPLLALAPVGRWTYGRLSVGKPDVSRGCGPGGRGWRPSGRPRRGRRARRPRAARRGTGSG